MSVIFTLHSLIIIILENCNDSSLRLVGGQSEQEGIVEVCQDGVWEPVCGDLWDTLTATVVCRQLGNIYDGENKYDCYLVMVFLTIIVAIDVVDHSGSRNDLIRFGDVDCFGNESSIFNCSYNSSVQCPMNSHAGVICASK